ncbi:MAG: FHA domain-containing protein [Candidatus Thiodiazotropha sp.]|jgi:pSer/pThr/pTyr-binding forkhead associated (FHA) protein
MEKFVVLSDDEPPQEFALVNKRLIIGRDGTCDICLRDRSVSRHHATLMRVFHGFSIEDERSTNGTKVNGSTVTKRYLKHGDLIEIGKYNIRYIAQVPSQEMDDDPDRTVVLNPITHQSKPSLSLAKANYPSSQFVKTLVNSVKKTPPLSEAPPATAPNAPMENAEQKTESVPEARAKVRFLSGKQSGEEKVIDRAFFSIGEPGGDLVLINRRHNGYYLLKVGGDNIPMINGQSIKAGGVELKNSDRITLGELVLEFIS